MIAGDRSRLFNGQRAFGELSSDRGDFQLPRVGGLIEYEFQRPHMVQECCLESICVGGGSPLAGVFTPGIPYPLARHHGTGVAHACD